MPTLHPQIVKALEAAARLGLKPFEELTPAEARAQMEATAASRQADPARLGVHGDSAGANLAAVAALLARDKDGPKLSLQSLVYPVADYTLSAPSYRTFAEGYGLLTAGAMKWFQERYLNSPADAEDWRASPLKAESHAGVAPAIIVTAECDVL